MLTRDNMGGNINRLVERSNTMLPCISSKSNQVENPFCFKLSTRRFMMAWCTQEYEIIMCPADLRVVVMDSATLTGDFDSAKSVLDANRLAS